MIYLFFLLSYVHADTNFEHCDSALDCLLVQDSWCKGVNAIQKNALAEWKSKDEEYLSLAKDRKQLCSRTGPVPNINNYAPQCYNHSCKAVSVR